MEEKIIFDSLANENIVQLKHDQNIAFYPFSLANYAVVQLSYYPDVQI